MPPAQIMGIGAFMRVFLGYVRPYRGKAIILLVLLAVDVAFKTAWPLSFKFLIDHALAGKDQRGLMATLAALIGGVLLATACSIVRDYLYAFLSSRVVHDLRSRAFTHLQRLSLAFYSRTRTGDVMGRFSTDLVTVENSLSWVIASLILNGTNIVVSAAVLMALEWRLALVTVFGLVLCVIVPRRFSVRASEIGYDKKTHEAQLANSLQENVTSQPAIKAFGLEDQLIRGFVAQSLNWSLLARRFYFFSNLVERTPNAIILMTEVAVMGGGMLLIFYGHLTLGTVVAFHALFLNLSSSVEGMTAVFPPLLQSMSGVQRIEELLAEPADEIPSNAAATPDFTAFQSRVSFEGVTFSYTGGEPNLNEIDLDIPKGSFVALVGGSGSGKSTVLNLLFRFYDCQSGKVRMDGREVRDISRLKLRAQMGLVFQENFLFNVSVRENIRFGRPDATDAEVASAAKAAEIHQAIVQLPQGYDTLAGERGSRLSGGQRQRIAIARALLRSSSILVLDEATSALDPATEESVNATIQQVARGRTVVSVTHRLSSIAQADRIYVFDQGRVVESGRHEELMAQHGLYAKLVQKQSGFTFNQEGDQAEVQPVRLRRFPILQELDEAILRNLAGILVTEVYPAERVVVQQGEAGDRFYIIARGKVRVSQARPDGPEEVVAWLDDGDYFGEMALLTNAPRNATVTTAVPCVFLSLRRQQFNVLMERAPQVLARLREGRSAPSVTAAR